MKKKRFLLFLLILVTAYVVLTGCKTQRDVVVERVVQRDTIYQDRTQYDSVFVEHNVFQDRSSDTILIREKEIEVRYRLKHDSIYIARLDTVTKTLTKTLTKARSPTWFDWISYTALALVIVYVWKRLTSR